MPKPDTFCAVAGATLVWLAALPSTAADISWPRKSLDEPREDKAVGLWMGDIGKIDLALM